jgi:hypothetical protein
MAAPDYLILLEDDGLTFTTALPGTDLAFLGTHTHRNTQQNIHASAKKAKTLIQAQLLP